MFIVLNFPFRATEENDKEELTTKKDKDFMDNSLDGPAPQARPLTNGGIRGRATSTRRPCTTC